MILFSFSCMVMNSEQALYKAFPLYKSLGVFGFFFSPLEQPSSLTAWCQEVWLWEEAFYLRMCPDRFICYFVADYIWVAYYQAKIAVTEGGKEYTYLTVHCTAVEGTLLNIRKVVHLGERMNGSRVDKNAGFDCSPRRRTRSLCIFCNSSLLHGPRGRDASSLP